MSNYSSCTEWGNLCFIKLTMKFVYLKKNLIHPFSQTFYKTTLKRNTFGMGFALVFSNVFKTNFCREAMLTYICKTFEKLA